MVWQMNCRYRMAILAFHATLTTHCFLLFLLVAKQLKHKPGHVFDPAYVDVQPHPDLDNTFVHYDWNL